MSNTVHSDKKQTMGRIYEVGFHILPTIGEEKVTEVFGQVRGFVEDGGGAVISSDMPKFRVLAYAISRDTGGKKLKFKEAYFSWIKFEGENSLAGALEKFMKNNDNVLRYLIIKTVRENTMTAPRIPIWKKREVTHGTSVKTSEEGKKETPTVSEDELNKAIDLAIAE